VSTPRYHPPVLSRAAIVVASLASASACAKKSDAPPAPALYVEGASCALYACNPGLVCTRTSKRCAKPEDAEVLKDRAAERERERSFLEQSGVAVAPPPAEAPVPQPPPTAEPPAAPTSPSGVAATSGAVRIVRVANKNVGAWVMAACRADERLVSGGCKLDDPNRVMPVDSYPSSDSPADTIGGRWNCGKKDLAVDLPLEAFALCQRL
jgi:hypothetical protein